MLRSITAARGLSSTSACRSFAKMQLLGTIGNIYHKETKDNRPFLTYSLAVERYAPSEATEGKTTVTDWYHLSVFNEKQVAFFQNHLGKGSQVYAEADIKQRTVLNESGEKLMFPSMNQTRFDVVRFKSKREAEAETEDSS